MRIVPSGLMARFIALAGVVLIMGMVGLGLWVSAQVERIAAANAGATTALYVDAMVAPVVVLAALCIVFGIFYRVPLGALTPGEAAVPPGIWNSSLAVILLIIGLVVGLAIYLVGKIGKSTRVTPMFVGGESVEPELV